MKDIFSLFKNFFTGFFVGWLLIYAGWLVTNINPLVIKFYPPTFDIIQIVFFLLGVGLFLKSSKFNLLIGFIAAYLFFFVVPIIL